MLEIWHNGVDIVLKSSLNLYYGGHFFFVCLNAMKFQKCFVKSQEYETMYYENLEQICMSQLLQRRFFFFQFCLLLEDSISFFFNYA